MNRADMSEETMSALIDEIVDGLFSVCVTLGVVPIIRCPRNNAAEQVAQVRLLIPFLRHHFSILPTSFRFMR